jgi:hypothetical protein
MRERINVPLQIIIAKLIAWLIFAIVISILLYGVVCKVHIRVRDRLQFPEVA